MNLKEYIKKNKRVHIPYIADKFNVTPQWVANRLLEYSNWTFKDNLVIFNYDGDRPRWLEVCDTKYMRGKTIPRDKEEFYSRNNEKADQHISVYAHDDDWKKHYSDTGNVKYNKGYVSPNHIYLELDRDTLKEAMYDAVKIYNNFPHREFMTFWYSGNRSIHIEVDARLFGWDIITDISKTTGYGKLYYNLAHKIAGDARHDNGIADPHMLSNNELEGVYEFTFNKKMEDLSIARKELETIDPNIYNRNSLIRQRYSYHEKGKKQKVMFTVKEMAEECGLDYVEPKEKEIKPYLVHWTFECYEEKRKDTPNYDIDVDGDKILKVYAENVDGFDPNEANSDGWINQLYSPFYDDTNPSVSVNINTGWYKDFGMPDHSFDVYMFYSKLKNIDYEKAKEELK